MYMQAETPICPMCCEKVYFAEEVRAVGKAFHKFCLKCNLCRKILNSTTVNDHEGELFCRTCYNKNFGPKGYGFAAGGAGLSTEGGQQSMLSLPRRKENGYQPQRSATSKKLLIGRFGGGDLCALCLNTVYQNERVDCCRKVYHKLCLKCGDCHHLLEKGSVNEHAGNIFCKGCYMKNYGTKGFVQGTSMHVA